MLTKPTLKLLLDFAQKQNDTSAKKLGQLTAQQKNAEKKLHLLLEYQHSYQSQFQDAAKNGIDQIEWLNFLAFMKKLDTAIIEQRESVTNADDNREAGREEFRSSQFKLKSYDTLSKRHQQHEMQQQIMREQKEQDEHKPTNSLYPGTVNSHNT